MIPKYNDRATKEGAVGREVLLGKLIAAIQQSHGSIIPEGFAFQANCTVEEARSVLRTAVAMKLLREDVIDGESVFQPLQSEKNRRHSLMHVSTACPHCGSADTQRVSVLVSAGTRSGSMSGSTQSWGDAGSNSGVFHGSTFSQTKLASRFSPRPPGDDVGLIVGAVVGILFGSILAYGQRSPVFGLVIVGLGVACAGVYMLGSGRRAAERSAHRRRLDYLEQAWFCHRCGTDWALRK